MQKLENQIEFTCPMCQKRFEYDQTYDQIGEYQLINCPECLAHLLTVKKSGQIELEYFEY
jgi:hypothetical protein